MCNFLCFIRNIFGVKFYKNFQKILASCFWSLASNGTSSKLSKGFPEVRVDFYDIAGKPFFGELTFSTGYGYFTDDYYDYLGDKVDIKGVKRIPTKDIISSIKIDG